MGFIVVWLVGAFSGITAATIVTSAVEGAISTAAGYGVAEVIDKYKEHEIAKKLESKPNQETKETK